MGGAVNSKAQKREAGKKSGLVRAAREKLRRRVVVVVYEQLKPAYRNQPYSTESFEALHDQYLKVVCNEKANILQIAYERIADKAFGKIDMDALSDDLLKNRVTAVDTRGHFADPRDKYSFWFYWRLIWDLDHLSQSERQMLTRVSDDTLIKDLKRLGIRSRRKQKRFG